MKLSLTLIAVAAAGTCQLTTCDYIDMGDGNYRTKVISMASTLENFKCGKDGTGCACVCAAEHPCTINHATGDAQNPTVELNHCSATSSAPTCSCDSPSFAFTPGSNGYTCTDGTSDFCEAGYACSNAQGDCRFASSMTSPVIVPAGGRVESEDSAFFLGLQFDGNLVVRKASDLSVMWASRTFGNDATGGRFAVQGDGNIVYRNAAGDPIWNSATHGETGAVELKMQNDGDLVLHRQSDGTLLWSSARGGKQ